MRSLICTHNTVIHFNSHKTRQETKLALFVIIYHNHHLSIKLPFIIHVTMISFQSSRRLNFRCRYLNTVLVIRVKLRSFRSFRLNVTTINIFPSQFDRPLSSKSFWKINKIAEKINARSLDTLFYTKVTLTVGSVNEFPGKNGRAILLFHVISYVVDCVLKS